MATRDGSSSPPIKSIFKGQLPESVIVWTHTEHILDTRIASAFGVNSDPTTFFVQL